MERHIEGMHEAGNERADDAPVVDPNTGIGAERDRPPALRIIVMIAALSAVAAGAVLGLWELFMLTSDQEITTKELEPGDPELAEVRSRDQQRLSGYDVIDAKDGRYQIPIEQAMATLVAHPEHLHATQPPAAVAGQDAKSGTP
jgi:hypothetical protein